MRFKRNCSSHDLCHSRRMSVSFLATVGIIALAMGMRSQGIAQDDPASGEANAPEALVESDAAVEGEPRRISDWALAGIVWSDTHLVRKLAQKVAAESDESQRAERMEGLIEDSDQIIEILKDFGWRRLEARQAEAEELPVEGGPVSPQATAGGERANPRADPPARELSARVESESPPGLNDPGVDDELQSPDADFDLNRYRVDDYIDEVPGERRSLADAVEDGVEEALAAGIDNISGNYGDRRGSGRGTSEGRLSQREMMTRSNTLPYSKDSIYDTDDFDPDVDYDVNEPLSEPVPSNSNPLIERVEDEDLENRPAESPGEVPSDAPDIEGEDDLVQELAEEGEVPASGDRSSAGTAVPDVSHLRRFTEQQKPFSQDAAWVQFQFDANQRVWQMVRSQPTDESTYRHLEAAVAQLQSHAQVGAQLTDDPRLATILRVIGGGE